MRITQVMGLLCGIGKLFGVACAVVFFSVGGASLYTKLILPDERGALVAQVVREQRKALFRETASAFVRAPVSIEQGLREGRQKYFEAMGYYRLGYREDAAPLFRRAIEILSLFIDSAPNDSRVPEALFLLGASYFHLSSEAPDGGRAGRLLHLCSDYYNGSVWATQANALWKSLRRGDT